MTGTCENCKQLKKEAILLKIRIKDLHEMRASIQKKITKYNKLCLIVTRDSQELEILKLKERLFNEV